VVAIVAVRRGALTLAVANVIGGNAFDALIVGAADVAYRDGSIYHRTTDDHLLLIGLTMLMTTLLIMGLLRRQRRGPGNIGFESAAVLALYAGAAVLLLT
jgi:cation:H+ antiporter